MTHRQTKNLDRNLTCFRNKYRYRIDTDIDIYTPKDIYYISILLKKLYNISIYLSIYCLFHLGGCWIQFSAQVAPLQLQREKNASNIYYPPAHTTFTRAWNQSCKIQIIDLWSKKPFLDCSKCSEIALFDWYLLVANKQAILHYYGHFAL